MKRLTNLKKTDVFHKYLINEVLRYYKKEDLGVSDTWQETLDRYRIYQIFDEHYFNNNDIEYTTNDIIQSLKTVLPELKRLLKVADHVSGYSDLRTGSETYDFNNIENDLKYISDRWNCSFRLRWLIELVELKTRKDIPLILDDVGYFSKENKND